jgi:outer membrane beta-barrel protein
MKSLVCWALVASAVLLGGWNEAARASQAHDPAPGLDGPAAEAPSPDPWGDERLGEPVLMVKLIGGEANVVRSGPGESYAIAGVFPGGARFRVLAKNGDWYNIRLSGTETGWVHASLCHEYEDLSHLEMRPNPRLYSRVGAFTLSGYAGGYAFDRKSNSLALGGRFGYYLLDFVELEGGVSWTHIHRPEEIVESLFNLRLEAEDFHMLYYQLGARVELLPGRRMVPYVAGGAGSSIFRGRSESSVNFGGGTLFFVSKSVATRWELRTFQFKSGSERARRTAHNIEFSFGSTVLF